MEILIVLASILAISALSPVFGADSRTQEIMQPR